MALTSRAARGMEMRTERTPGPGEYGSSKNDTTSKNYIAFASSSARRLGPKYDEAPGPGMYLALPRTENEQVSMSVFASRSKRNYIQTTCEKPGPGAYRDPFKEYKLMSRPRKVTSVIPQVVAEPRFTPPAIPARHQSTGYHDGAKGQLEPLSEGKSISKNRKLRKPKRKKGASFALSKTERAPSFIQSKNLNAPGPGSYETFIKDTVQVPSSCFRSTVTRDSISNETTKALTPRDPTPEKEDVAALTGSTKTNSSFGSKAERCGWHRDATKPYVDPTSNITPGPGAYNCNTHQVPTERAPFNSTDTRPCLTGSEQDRITKFLRGKGKAPTRKVEPGPGAYRALFDIEVLHMGHREDLKSIQNDEDTASKKVVDNDQITVVLEPSSVPLNNNNNNTEEQHYQHQEQPQHHVIKRMATRPRPIPRPALRSSSIPVSSHDDSLRVGADPNEVEACIEPEFCTDRNPVKTKTLDATFASRSSRLFGSDRHIQDDLPGPADYEPERAFRRKERQVKSRKIPQEARFRDAVSDRSASHIGPGAYLQAPCLVKKSFNVTYSTEKKLVNNSTKDASVHGRKELSQITCNISTPQLSVDTHHDLLLTGNNNMRNLILEVPLEEEDVLTAKIG